MSLAHEKRVRFIRNRLLAESDWRVMPDSPLSPEKKQEWSAYRQALRDITMQEGFPTSVIFPGKPA